MGKLASDHAKRGDLSGKAHDAASTPHAHDFGKPNELPDGTKRADNEIPERGSRPPREKATPGMASSPSVWTRWNMFVAQKPDDESVLTKYFQAYRECARIIWNLFLMPYPDGEHDFFPISRALCDAMVVSQSETYRAGLSIDGIDFYPSLCVLPPEGKEKLAGLIATKELDFYSWKVIEWTADLGDLRFRSLFDFEPFGGVLREFRYAECVIVRSNDDGVRVGQRVLLDAIDVRIVDASTIALDLA